MKMGKNLREIEGVANIRYPNDPPPPQKNNLDPAASSVVML